MSEPRYRILSVRRALFLAIGAAIVSAAGYVTPADAEVVAKYEFTSGTAEDTSGHGNDGAITGDPEMIEGFIDSAMRYDGVGDYVVVPHSSDLQLQTFSITVWMRADKILTHDSTVLEKWQDGHGYRLTIDGASGAIRFEIGGGLGNEHVVESLFPLFGNAWTTVTATYDGATLSLYIDGTRAGQTSASGLDLTNEADLFIAANAELDRLFEGDIDEVVIENTSNPASFACTMSQKLWHESSETCLDGFTDVTDELGLGDEEHSHFGVCLVDVNQDGWIDVYYANGKGPPVQPDIPVDGVCQDLDPDEPPPHPVANENTFYLNNGDGTFTTDLAGGMGIADIWVAMQNVFGDYDNDGRRDLLSHNFLRSPLYRQVSGPDPMVFQDVSEEANMEVCLIRGTGACWVDLDNDGWLDTYGVEYEAGADSTALLSVMYLNNRDGTFTEITDEAGVGAPSNAMGIGFGDYDNDGDQDLFQTNSPPWATRLYRNDGVNPETGLPQFTDVAAEAGVAVSDEGNLGVATAWGDYNNDGFLDLLFAREFDSRLWRNNGPDEQGVWTFTDVTGEGGWDVDSFRFWEGNFADLDNDGWLDIVMTNLDVTGINQVFLNNRDGTWREVSDLLGMQLPEESQMGFIPGDLDNDGDLDVVLLGFEFGHPNTVFRNRARGNNWIQFNLSGTAGMSNLDAIGARITVTAAPQPGEPAFQQIREVIAGTGLFSDFPRIQTFGLGKARIVSEVRIDWPSSQPITLINVPINQRIKIVEGDPAPTAVLAGVSLSGPSLVLDNDTHDFTADADYYYAVAEDVTADAVWSVDPGDYAEFTAPGELTLSTVPSAQTVTVRAILGEFEASKSVVIQPFIIDDTEPPTVSITAGASLTTEQDTVALAGTAVDDRSAITAVTWSSDQGKSGPCSGLSNWDTGTIELSMGFNAIAVTARDAAGNEGTSNITVERVLPTPKVDVPPDDEPDENEPDDPVDVPDDDVDDQPDDDVGNDEPDETPIDDGDPPGADEPDSTIDEDPSGSPQPGTDGEGDGGNLDSNTPAPNPSASACGLIGLLNYGLLALGLWAVGRRKR